MTEKIYDNITKETVLKYISESGVTVYMLPMKGSSTAAAQISARFGSLDNCFSSGDGKVISVPDGTAHYLEHKLFESEEKDAFSLFAQTGASCNAGTSFDYTKYYFTCTQNFEKNLDILLSFVSEPYFTPENVEKERGIIGQEITMYRDNPSWRVFLNLLRGVYSKNPVRNDIAGSVESIAEITEKTLYECYDAFYNPANMFLTVAGNFNPDEVIRVCEKRLSGRKPLNVIQPKMDEPESVFQKKTELVMPVSKPIFEIGFKRRWINSAAALEDYICFNLLFDSLFADSSDFFERMRSRGLINEEWSVSVMSGRGFLFPTAHGEGENPGAVLEEMQRVLRESKKNPPSRETFDRIKKATYGALMKDYENPFSVSSTLMDAALADLPPFSAIDAAASAEYEDMLRRLEDFDEENVCISIVKGE